MNAATSAVRRRRIGCPPEFNGVFSRTSIKLTRAQWSQLEDAAERRGQSFREFLKSRLKAALKDVLESIA